MSASRPIAALCGLLLALSLVGLGLFVFQGLGSPLLWEDEAATALYGGRVLEYGYPKVHDSRNPVYPSSLPMETGVDASLDAFLGAPWAPFYVAAVAEAFARGAGEPWARTGRVRLVFASLGAAGLLILLGALLPLVGADRQRRAVAAAGFLALCAGSISLVLHLRQVSAEPLAAFLMAASLFLVLRRETPPRRGPGYGLALAPLLFVLLDTSVLAGCALTTTLVVVALGRMLRSRADGSRLRGLALELAPVGLAWLAFAPLLAFHGPETLWAGLAGPEPDDEAGYARRLAVCLMHLLRYDWLAPVLLGRLGTAILRRVPGGSESVGQRERLAAADLLSLLVGVQLLLVALLPAFHERQLVVLAPILAAILVLDAVSLLDWTRARQGGARAAGVAAVSLMSALLAVSIALHATEIRGRIQEMGTPYRGPLDHIVEYLLANYEQPRDLVVATNSEGASLRYYLDAIVLVDFNATQLQRDYLLQPDVIIPRPWYRTQKWLSYLAVRTPYDQEDLPSENFRFNQVPTLSPRDASGQVHRFRSAEVGSGRGGVPILYRPR